MIPSNFLEYLENCQHIATELKGQFALLLSELDSFYVADKDRIEFFVGDELQSYQLSEADKATDKALAVRLSNIAHFVKRDLEDLYNVKRVALAKKLGIEL